MVQHSRKICVFVIVALFLLLWRFLGSPKSSKITKICNFGFSGIRKIGKNPYFGEFGGFGKLFMVKIHEICNFAFGRIFRMRKKPRILPIFDVLGKPTSPPVNTFYLSWACGFRV